MALTAVLRLPQEHLAKEGALRLLRANSRTRGGLGVVWSRGSRGLCRASTRCHLNLLSLSFSFLETSPSFKATPFFSFLAFSSIATS